jgi:hypothetical protein
LTIKNEDGSENKIDEAKIMMQASFIDITADIQILSESKRNSLSADQIFCLYLRDCSQLVHEQYYKQIVQFMLMFHECVNIYGWQKRAEYECREFFG